MQKLKEYYGTFTAVIKVLCANDAKLMIDTENAKKAALNDYRLNLKQELNEFVDQIVAEKHDYYRLL